MKQSIRLILSIMVAILLLLIVKYILYANNVKNKQKELKMAQQEVLKADTNEEIENYMLDELLNYEKAKEKLEKMSLDEKVSQMFLVRCPKNRCK